MSAFAGLELRAALQPPCARQMTPMHAGHGRYALRWSHVHHVGPANLLLNVTSACHAMYSAAQRPSDKLEGISTLRGKFALTYA